MALIYQQSVETSVYLSAEIILRRGSRVIHQTFVSLQFQRKNKRVLINVAAGNKRDLNITPLYYARFNGLAPRIYDMKVHYTSKRDH